MGFSARVVELALLIPAGRVTTYGHLARAAGGTGQAARSISSILSKYPNKQAIPWHRIVYANGRIWFDDSIRAERIELLAVEGIEVNQKGCVADFEEKLLDFSEVR